MTASTPPNAADTSASAAPGAPVEGWVLYDAACGFCSRWVPHWRNVLERHGFAIEALQAGWIQERLALPEEDLMRDILILTAAGDLIRGADAYRYVMRRIWWARPIQIAAELPILRQLFDAAYRRFADNRYSISRACHMPASSPEVR
jgi:predicted DCC family thiol-disulfide oxidoreductase YuxK